MVQPNSNSKWRRIQDSLESADWRHRPIAALFQEVQKALLGCSCDPEKSWTSRSWKKAISPTIMLWNIYTFVQKCVLTLLSEVKPQFQGKKGTVTQGNLSTESNAIPCTQDTIKVIIQTKWIKQSPNTTVFTNFCFWSYPVWKSWGRELQECSAWGDI